LLLLGTIALAWLPIDGMPGDPMPARRALGLGENPILDFAFAPDGATIAAIQAYRVILRDAKGVGGAVTVLDRPGMARVLTFSPDGRSLFAGGGEPDLFLYRFGEDGAGHPLAMPSRRTSSLAVSPDGRILAASSYRDPEILLWDLAAGREHARLRGHGSPVVSLAFAPDGRSLASGAQRHEGILLWDLATGRPRRRLGKSSDSTVYLTYSPDGRWLAATEPLSGSLRLWDSEGRREDRLNPSCSGSRNAVAFSPDGRLLATAGADGAVRLWDPATGAELRRVGDPADRLHSVAFSPDGRLLAAAGTDSEIRLWDLAEVLGSRDEP
jgi:WD40 repeat protein